MAVTRLERKGRKNKTVAKVRVATIKRLKTKTTVASQYKEESGHVIGDVTDVISGKATAPAETKVEETAAE